MEHWQYVLPVLVMLGNSCAGLREDPVALSAPDGTSFEDRICATIPDDVSCDYFIFSRHGTAATYRAKKDGKSHVVHNNKWSPPLDEVEGPWISDDGTHVACRFREAGKFKLLLDGVKWETDGDIQYPHWSPDGSRWAATGKKGLKEFMLVDGVRSEEFDYVGRPVFSPDGKRLAYCARTGDRQWVVLDGQKQTEYGPYEEIVVVGRANIPLEGKPEVYLPRPEFGSDARSLAYPALRAGKCFVVVDGKEGEAFDYVESPIWSPGGKRLAYIARVEKKYCVVIDGVKGAFYDCISGSFGGPHPVFSTDGSTLAYFATRGHERILVMDDKRIQVIPYAHADGPALSPRGTRAAFVAGTADSRTLKGALERAFIVVDSKEGPVFDVIWYDVAFSPDGSRITYIARGIGNNGARVVVDHHSGEWFDWVSLARFSRDSHHFAYWASRGNQHFVVIDNRAGEPYDEVQSWPITFSPDSTRVAFGVRQGRHLRWVVRKV